MLHVSKRGCKYDPGNPPGERKRWQGAPTGVSIFSVDSGYTLFKTTLGHCALAWGGRKITAIQLPEPDSKSTVRCLLSSGAVSSRAVSSGESLRRRTPPVWVGRAIRKIARHLEGKPQDLASLPLDMEGISPFFKKVYGIARQIVPGKTLSYGELASRAGSPGAARAAGQAMARNPFPLVVPCHRVLASGNNLGGFSAFGGLKTKQKLLALEGAGAALPSGGGSSLFEGSDGLDFDPRVAMRLLSRADSRLGRIIRLVGRFRLKLQTLQSPYEALAEAIVYQQLTARAASTILSRVKALSGRGRFPRPRRLLETSDAALRLAGLSRGKARALRDLAARELQGGVPTLERMRRMGDEEIVQALVPIRGIGRWTVEMLLIFRLGRPDVLPVDDYGLRRGFRRAFNTRELPPPESVRRRGERWHPFRSVASWYLWRAAELPS